MSRFAHARKRAQRGQVRWHDELAQTRADSQDLRREVRRVPLSRWLLAGVAAGAVIEAVPPARLRAAIGFAAVLGLRMLKMPFSIWAWRNVRRTASSLQGKTDGPAR